MVNVFSTGDVVVRVATDIKQVILFATDMGVVDI